MKKSRIIALLTAAVMIMSVVPAMANVRTAAGGYFVDSEGAVYEKSGENLISNPGFEEGLTGLTQNAEYYEVSAEAAHGGSYSLKAIKSTKGEGAITAYIPVDDAHASYYLSFWYKNTDNAVARRPRVTFAFTDSSKVIPTEEDDFTDETNAWIGAGTASNDQDMEYSMGEWVQYSTVLKGNGNATACAYAALNIYGLTKNVAYVDDFELYELIPSEEYGDDFAKALENWEKQTMPQGSLEGFGTLDLPRETGVDGIAVQWSSSTVAINAETGEYSSQAEEELAILTARIYVENREEIYFEYEYPYIVKSMFVPYVEWVNAEVFAKLGSAISGDITLPASHEIEGYYPAAITWSCSDEAVLSGDGTYTAPETTKYVDIVATIECNGKTTTATKRVKAIGGNLVDDGLIMYYDFEKPLGGSKNNIVYDNSQKENVYNAESLGVTIVDGYAKFSGGSAAITLPSNYGTELTGSYSVSMWVNIDKVIATSSGMYRFFDFGGGQYTSQFLRYIPGTGQLSFMDRGKVDNGDTWAINTNVTDMAQTWKLVTFTYEKGTTSSVATVYIDGVKIADSGANTTLTNSISNITGQSSTRGFIGRTQWFDSNSAADNPDFMGLMDDIRIYNRAITADEIATLYAETRPTVTAPITIKFQDLEGNTLKDDVTVSADVNTTYDVAASYKSIPSYFDGQYRHVYKYLASQSVESIYVSADSENVCVLVFQEEKQVAGTNLIANPSFEENLDGWTYNNNGTFGPLQGWARSTEVVYDGNYSLKKTVTSGNGGTTNNNIGTYIPIEPGKKYTLSWWEHSSADKAAGDHQMMAAVVTSDNTSALGTTANRITSCGGWDSWNKDAMGQATRDPAYTTGWTQRVFEFDTTQTPNAAYILVAYANGDATSVDYIDAFILEETGASSDTPETDENKIPVTIQYVDVEGNKLCEDVIVYVNQGINEYTVPVSYKKLATKCDELGVHKYIYNAAETFDFNPDPDHGGDFVSLSILRDNIATLVFDVIELQAQGPNLVADGSFEDSNGNFSWGNWQSPQGDGYFSNIHNNYFYTVNRDTNASVLDKTGLNADDYALGTRWNDGVTGLCSMANFIPVEAGKTYFVAYDYKHSVANTDASYISTSFVESTSFDANATGYNIPKSVTTEWQTNMFTITAPKDGYIYFHFSYVGSGGGGSPSNNSGNGPYWYFDNFEVFEFVSYRNNIKYVDGYAEILAENGTEGYLVQAMYSEEGELTSVVISDKLTLNEETATKVEVQAGAKLMLVKDLTSLEPLAPAIIAK